MKKITKNKVGRPKNQEPSVNKNIRLKVSVWEWLERQAHEKTLQSGKTVTAQSVIYDILDRATINNL